MKWAFMYTIVATLAVIATSFVVTQQIQAQEGKMIITFLSGKDEVSLSTESDASAWAKFQSVDNDSHLSYWGQYSWTEGNNRSSSTQGN